LPHPDVAVSAVPAIDADGFRDHVARDRGRRFAGWVFTYLIAALLLAALSLFVGTSTLRTSLEWLRSPAALSDTVLWDIRLPRAVGAWLVGALLGLGGAIAQTLFRNPLAEPYLLGSASGAALGVTICLLTADATITGLAWMGTIGMTGAAFLGAAAGITLTLTLSRGVHQTTNLLLAGVVVAFVLGALTSLFLLQSPDTWRAMQSFLLGTTGFLGWRSTALLAVVFAGVAVPTVLLSRGLDALTLGEDTARSLGLPLKALRVGLLGLLSLATAAAVSQAGIVGFVGLVAPHLVRESVHVNSRQLMIAAPLCAGVVLQAADLVSRWVIRPAELPVGIVTACLGGSYLVVLLWRRAQRE
jgi:iron complex transport system permease protein